ncbi:MAG: serine hydrolase [Bacteroidota bacterium]
MRNTTLSFLLISIFMCSCITRKGAFQGQAWERHASPQAAGFNPEKLAALDQYIDSSNTTGLIAIYDGKVIYEYGDLKKVSYLASCRKSVLAMLYGKYIEDGTVDLNQSIGELGITEADGLLPIEKTAKVDHIITSRSGVFHIAANGGYDLDNFKRRGSVQPGDYFVYSNWDFNVGGHLLEQYAGKNIYEEMEEQFAKPLGFQDWHIKNQRKSGKKKKSQYLAYHFYLSTRDMAKLGQLMLNQGEWQGQQLISQNWVRKITSTVTPQDTVLARGGGYRRPDVPKYSYGYMWWLFDELKGQDAYEGSFSATGYGGQYLTVIPKQKLVIAHKTKLDIPTLLGWKYHETPEWVYYHIVDQIVNARE